ncbi:MAG: glycosyltransferase [Planctomycetes bacterium]|nr:glycosyltransferase [Planctomycetota bacterium]
MTATPLVSVIVRTRNRPWYLRQALEGLAAQTFRDFETLVLNDGGEDVAALVGEFGGRLTCRYFHCRPGRGRCGAANLGLAEARGERIAYLDDDDLYYPDHLAVLVETSEAEKADVAYSNANEVIHTAVAGSEGYREVGRALKLDHDFSRARFFLHSYIHLVTLMHRKRCTERVGGFDESLEVLEDLDLCFRLAQEFDFVHVRRVTAEYRIRDDATNAVTSMPREFQATRQQIYAKYIHLILPELIKYTEHKDHIVTELMRRVEALERRVGG